MAGIMQSDCAQADGVDTDQPNPQHVAIIMDGNGRWAQARGLPRTEGHRKGVEAVRRTVKAALTAGIGYLTIFSFSSENWSRPPSEVKDLLGLLRLFIRSDLAKLDKQGVRVRVIGARDNLSDDLKALLNEAEEKTAHNNQLTFVVAFNYGGRDDIARAVTSIASDVKAGLIEPGMIDEQLLASRLDTAGIPDPDLLIRTSGEQRISNFLLWQAAYAEFVFQPIYWPDFDQDAFNQALAEYRDRERRYGGVCTAKA